MLKIENCKMNIDSEFKEKFLNGINDFKDIGISQITIRNAISLCSSIFYQSNVEFTFVFVNTLQNDDGDDVITLNFSTANPDPERIEFEISESNYVKFSYVRYKTDCQYTKSIFVSDFSKIPTEVEFMFKRK